MSKAPFRIATTSGSSEPAAAGPLSGENGQFNEYLEKLTKMIPAEVIGLYLIGSGLIPAGQNSVLLCWTIFCLVGVIAVRTAGSRDAGSAQSPQWGAVIVASVSFVIWIYSMGGVFQVYLGQAYKPYIGSLLVLAWTFLAPLLYRPTA